MKELFKLVTWLTLVIGWLAAVVWALVFDTFGLAAALAIMGVFCWVAWAAFLAWLFGLRRRVRRHLGRSLKEAAFLDKEVGASRLADARRALESLYADKDGPARRYGVQTGYEIATLRDADTEIKPIRWFSFESQPGQYEVLPSNAVYLLHHEDRPFAVQLITTDVAAYGGFDEPGPVATGPGGRLRVFGEALDDAARAIDYVLRVASVGSVFRGKMLYVSSRGPGLPGQAIRVSDRPEIGAERIVLPPEVLGVVHRTISRRLEFHRLLERHGHSSKTGILLHGAPGTGKTLVAKHLIGVCPNHTAIVPMGMETETIREAFRLAAYLQPALVVIEDVDLLAERRETNANVTGLQELMNEMDGLAPSTEAIVLMTTNRPDVLEPALASRPGRVSQAIHFPLPDAPLRKTLLRIFLAQADLSHVDLRRWVERTAGASPAFLEELAKRAILFAAQRLPAPDSEAMLQLQDCDLDQSIHELVVFGGDLTSKVLGFRTAATE